MIIDEKAKHEGKKAVADHILTTARKDAGASQVADRRDGDRRAVAADGSASRRVECGRVGKFGLATGRPPRDTGKGAGGAVAPTVRIGSVTLRFMMDALLARPEKERGRRYLTTGRPGGRL